MDPKRVLSGAAFLILILAIIAVIYMTLKKLYNESRNNKRLPIAHLGKKDITQHKPLGESP